MKKSYGALVVGAGIGGIRAALDLADIGNKVALIDKRHHTGGILVQLDHQFPSDHCGMCKMLPIAQRDASSQFCMRKGLFHKNIDIMLSTELTGMDGDPGSFQITLSRRSPFVDPTKCIGCGICSEVCPVRVPDEFNAGLTKRAAVHLPVPHHIPNHYMVDLENCARCWRCHESCPTGAIDFKFDERKSFQTIVACPDPVHAEEMTTWLEGLHFAVATVNTGQAAIDAMTAHPETGMVLLDMTLADPEAERVMLRCLEINPKAAVILLAEQGRQARAAEALAAKGARRALTRPVDRTRLTPWLDKLYMRLATDETVEIEAASVILATGFDPYNPADNPNGMADSLMYGTHPGVVTAVEFERMLSGTGPHGGAGDRLVRTDGEPVRRVAWLQCVGSRDVKLNADYCSSICCMFSIKEALLAKRTAAKAGHDLDAAIFCMDMRTFGKNYQRYKDEAENEQGVRFVRSRIHSVLPEPPGGGNGLLLEWVDDAGKPCREIFDMVVLATGGKPASGTEELAEVTGAARNAWGFIDTRTVSPGRTSRYGVMAAGASSGPKDIAESMLHSGAAALEASRLINLYAPLREKTPDPEPHYRNVSREAPRTVVALCTSCPTLESALSAETLEALATRLAELPSVVRVERVSQGCTASGWQQIADIVTETEPNRVLIGACQPYAYVPKLRELGAVVGLNPVLMNVVDIHTMASQHVKFNGKSGGDAIAEAAERETLLREVYATLSMAAVKLADADPSGLPSPVPVNRVALVVGGGLAGMTAALGIADHGYPVHLVEERDHLGGLAINLRYTLEGDDPVKFMEDLITQVEKHPNITVHRQARISLSTGRAGRFLSLIAMDQGALPVEHGVTVLATGGSEARVYDFGFRVHKTVLTQLELEHKLASGELDTGALSAVAMIQCFRSREESRNYCSRVCCASAIKNILQLKKRRPDLPVYVFYRDMMTYGFMEQYYTQARKAGAIFFRYERGNRPSVAFEDGKPVITAMDPVMQRKVRIEADLLALSTGIEPNDASEMSELFGVPLTEDGFYQEAESKWRPVDCLKRGVFLCGIALAPGTMRETIASAKAAASRALRILSEKRLVANNVVAEVRDSLCSRCGKCISVCPYGARSHDMEHDRIIVDELLCQGCGSCAAICPNSATVLRGFRDGQIMSVIDAALGTKA
ncbi:MAG: 4Fe-4S binding protein [Desulfovibrionaceae bacterium]